MGHKLDDDTLITPDLLRYCIQIGEAEGNNGQHYLVAQQASGGFLEHNPGSPELEEMQAIFARDLLRMLNKELHHDGAWVIVFSAPGQLDHLLQSRREYGWFTILWMDRDGDVQLEVQWVNGETDELDFSDVLLSGIESWAERCEHAWVFTKHLTDSLEIKRGEEGTTFKKAKGERRPSTRH